MNNDNNLRQKETKKWLPTLFKFIKEADAISVEIDHGIFEFPNRKVGFIEAGYDGNSVVRFSLYHKKQNQIEEVLKRACGGEK